MLVLGFFRQRKLDQLDFFELMLADQAARVLAVAARFAAKTRRVRSVIYRQICGVEYLVGVIIRHRNLGRRDQGEAALVV